MSYSALRAPSPRAHVVGSYAPKKAAPCLAGCTSPSADSSAHFPSSLSRPVASTCEEKCPPHDMSLAVIKSTGATAKSARRWDLAHQRRLAAAHVRQQPAHALGGACGLGLGEAVEVSLQQPMQKHELLGEGERRPGRLRAQHALHGRGARPLRSDRRVARVGRGEVVL